MADRRSDRPARRHHRHRPAQRPARPRDSVARLLAGLRTGEISRLRWCHVDLTGGQLRFIGKGDKPAVVTLARALVDELVDWRAIVTNQLGPLSIDAPVVCATRFPKGVHARSAAPGLLSEPIGSDGLATIVHNRGLRIGIADLRPHDLRRTLAGMLDDQGARLQDVRLILRHDRLATTEAYLADNPRRVEQRMRALTLPT